MTEDDKRRASHALFEALLEGPQTFGSLWPIANAAIGCRRSDHTAPGYRFADKWLQKQRRAKRIRLSRRVWELTSEGRQMTALTSG